MAPKKSRKKNKYSQEDILSNMGLVYWVVGRVLRRLPSFRRQDKEDLVSYGVLGLIYALEYWDWRNGFEFSSYAVPCIKGYVLYGNSKMTKAFTPIHNRRRISGGLKGLHDDPVTSLEHALHEMTERAFYHAAGGSTRGLVRWKFGGVQEEHLYSPLPGPFELACTKNLEKRVRVALNTLTPREEKVIRMHFGIGEASDYTLEEIGNNFEVGKERIRQIEMKALRRLRSPDRSKMLRAFYR